MRRTHAYGNTKKTRVFTESLGVDLFGIADLKHYQDRYEISKPLLNKFPFAISFAVRLSNTVIENITEEDPTETYVHHYQTINTLLNRIGSQVTEYCEAEGYDALSIPASQIQDENKLLGALSHKAVAVLAGLGWLGKSLLVVNETFGPRIRLGSVVTTLPLHPHRPAKNRCGQCRLCKEICPENAIKGVIPQDPILSREEVVDVNACNRRLRRIADNPRYGVRVCGLCIKVCPWGTT